MKCTGAPLLFIGTLNKTGKVTKTRNVTHILPKGFRKIRHYGFLSNRFGKSFRQQQLQMGIIIKPQNLEWKTIAKEKLHFNPEDCPCCKKGKMRAVLSFDNNGPPAWAINISRQQITAS